MTPRNDRPSRKPIPLIFILAGLAGLAVILAAAGFSIGATKESQDSFCASCHTQPESTYYERSTAASAVDLASFHTAQQTRCIDCHSGEGVFGRIGAELLGARNAFHWYTGTAVQPAVLTKAIGDDSCLKCHEAVTQEGYQLKMTTLPGSQLEEGRAGHWHRFLARWQSTDKNAGRCVSCHSGHSTGSSAEDGFMDINSVETTCNACHLVLRGE